MVALATPSTSSYYWAWSRNLRAASCLPAHSGGRAAFVNVNVGAGCHCRRKRMSTASAAIEEKANTPAADVVVQYVVLRRDLIDTWPLGSVITQGCHASVAAIWSHKDDPVTLEYCSPSNLDSMHKVTLQVKGETQILNLSEKLKAGGIDHKLWVEQPENIPTCLATKPYPKSLVSSYFKKLQLCKHNLNASPGHMGDKYNTMHPGSRQQSALGVIIDAAVCAREADEVGELPTSVTLVAVSHGDRPDPKVKPVIGMRLVTS
ncbi:hypothetical protein V2J09_010842 [Rumex salicifolius]